MKRLTIKGSPLQGLTAATIGFFFGSAAISLFGPSAALLHEVMDLSPSMMGLLVAIPSLSGSLLRIPLGAAVDANGGRKPFLLLMILSTIGLLGLTLLLTLYYPNRMEGTYGLILLLGCLSGCGIATFSVGSGQISYWYSSYRQGSVLGLFGGFGTLGAGLFAFLLPLLLEHTDLAAAYCIWTILILVGTLIYYRWGCNAPYFQFRRHTHQLEKCREMAQEQGQELFPTGNMKESLLASARFTATWILVAAYLVTFGGFLALTAWLPTYWQNAFDFSPLKAGLFTALYASLAALFRIPGGRVADRLGGLKVSLFAIILLGTTAALMAFSANSTLSLVCTLLIAVAFGLNNAAIMKLIPVYIPHSIGGAAGWVGGVGAFGGFLIPPMLGQIAGTMGRVGYFRGFLLFTLMSVVVLSIIYWGVSRSNKPKNQQP